MMNRLIISTWWVFLLMVLYLDFDMTIMSIMTIMIIVMWSLSRPDVCLCSWIPLAWTGSVASFQPWIRIRIRITNILIIIMMMMMVMMIFTLYLLYTPSSLHRGLQSWCLQPNYRIYITFPNLTFPLVFFTLKITAPLMLINCQEIPWYQKEIECLRCSRPSCPSPPGLKRSNVEIQKILDNWKEWYSDLAQSPK